MIAKPWYPEYVTQAVDNSAPNGSVTFPTGAVSGTRLGRPQRCATINGEHAPRPTQNHPPATVAGRRVTACVAERLPESRGLLRRHPEHHRTQGWHCTFYRGHRRLRLRDGRQRHHGHTRG